jgi:hypothetical protein
MPGQNQSWSDIQTGNGGQSILHIWLAGRPGFVRGPISLWSHLKESACCNKFIGFHDHLSSHPFIQCGEHRI